MRRTAQSLKTASAAAARDFTHYACAGGIGTALHYAVFVLVTAALPGAPTASGAVGASTAGAALGAAANYLLNYRFSFRSSRRHGEAVPRFALVAAVSLAINGATVGALCAGGLAPLPAQLAATAAVLVFGFLFNRHWSFA